ncbi:MAG: indoleacetamide hydrolase [Alphaproteobacteria bacterium]|nr:indoleacetamide hydrolase [Alphaproteobacteria bacterium]
MHDHNKHDKLVAQIDALIARYQTMLNLNAFTHFDAAYLQAEAAKLAALSDAEKAALPLYGIPFVVKDNIDTKSMPSSAGTPALKGKTPAQNAPAIDRLLEKGALLAGKTNMHELAFGITSNNAAFGPVRNPYQLDKIAGGSTGGTAAAIAAGLTEIGLGTDTGGSIRIPAALCGIIGFRPTMGRYDNRGVLPLSHTRDTIGLMAKQIELLARFDEVLAGAQEADEAEVKSPDKLRLGVPQAYFHDILDEQVAACFEQVKARLADAQITLVAAELDNVAQLNEAVSFPIVLYEVMQDLPAYLAARGQADLDGLIAQIASPDVKAILQSLMGEGSMPQAAYQAAIEQHRPALQETYRAYFDTHELDAMLVMTTPLPACAIGEDETVSLCGEQVPTFNSFIRNTDPTSNAGYPALTLPAGLSAQGLPIGVELVAPAHKDRQLLQIGAGLINILGTIPPPPTS